MPRKAKPKEPNPTPSQPPKRTKEKDISWDKNPAWIHTAISFLTQNPELRIKLFSDSTQKATKDGRKKIQGHVAKINWWAKVAEDIYAR
ncbi:uncharacterized protein B0H18DRAFT_828779, partial [Fomitopsis serialis]|uniref:uncharacterized protein n=1 Tax=Fomitopsis serialis TaxID=139415 RepID=UPI0020083F96